MKSAGLSSAHFVLCAGDDPIGLAYYRHTVQEDAGVAPLLSHLPELT
jgi:hypothetical protein